MKVVLILVFSCIILTTSFAQGVSVNETGAEPHESAVLDVQSDSKGMLIPRLNTVQRVGIDPAASGLLVYDTNTRSFWYRLSNLWVELTDNFHGLRDTDNDTKVQVEESTDEDLIRFDIGNVEAMVLTESTEGATRLDIKPDPSLIIGRDAGLNTIPGWNVILGPNAGEFNTSGQRNVFVGYRAGQNNDDRDRSVLIGYEAGVNNEAGHNTMIGYQSGHANSTGGSNTFYGYQSGIQNTIGYRNTFLGQTAGHNNRDGFENTIVGFSAGYNSVGDRNTFIGLNAGMRNRTGNFNVAVGARAGGLNLNSGDMGNGNVIMGYEAGFSIDSSVGNTLIGYQTAFSINDGLNNTYIGSQAGLSLRNGNGNVGIGVHALSSNRDASFNVAVGDSALMENSGSGNVALGSKAGLENTTGFSNTFLGRDAGFRNTTGVRNTFVGRRAGSFNKDGAHNVFVGAESGNANDDGEFNTFSGYASGFRNSAGDNNVFLGTTAGQYNVNGSSNIAIGLNAMALNSDGHSNIAIGEQALGNLTGNSYPITGNIAIGDNAARNIDGNENIIIGNESGTGMAGTENILLGNDISPLGYNNIYIGAGTSADIFGSPHHATAIGSGARISQDYSVILGDASVAQARVGVGTITPQAKMHLRAATNSVLIAETSQGEAFSVLSNKDVVVNDRLLVNTLTGKPGYEISVNGSIACEEVLVQNSMDWPDYVFQDDYELMSLFDLKKYLKQENHLPGIPSADEVADNGIAVGDMQVRLLEKVEELTLYIIELESRLAKLEKK